MQFGYKEAGGNKIASALSGKLVQSQCDRGRSTAPAAMLLVLAGVRWLPRSLCCGPAVALSPASGTRLVSVRV